MKRNMRMLPVFSVVVLTFLLITAPKLWPQSIGVTTIIIEVNATAEDAGIQIFVDAEDEWKRLEIFDPNGQKIYDVRASGSAGKQGTAEFFVEFSEPNFQEQPLEELFKRFPEGIYTVRTTTVDGETREQGARLRHNIPDGPKIVFPPEGQVRNANTPLVINWDPVTKKFPDTDKQVNIRAYQVIVERVKPTPLRIFSVTLRFSTTHVTVPPEFLQPNAEYIGEVLAIDASGNQTISEFSFKTD